MSDPESVETSPREPVLLGDLPDRPADYMGRHDEAERGLLLLQQKRLVSLTGAPGIGKTSLATDLAKRALRDQDLALEAVLWLRLGSMARADALIADVGSLLSLDTQSELTAQDLARRIGDTRLLLVLDGAEGLLQKDRAGLRAMLDALLWECSGLFVLVATQALVGSLMAVEENELYVGPLAEESARALLFAAAGEGLSEREKQGQPIQRLVEWLGGHPFATKLVATQTKRVSIEALVNGLEEQEEAPPPSTLAFGEELRRTQAEQRIYERLAQSLDLCLGALDEREPGAAEMFAWLAQLPAGLPRPLLSHVFGSRAEIDRETLFSHFLVEEHGSDRRLGVPASLRRYARQRATGIATDRQRRLLAQSFGALSAWLTALSERLATPQAGHALLLGPREEANLVLLLRAMERLGPPKGPSAVSRTLAEHAATSVAAFARLMPASSRARAAEEAAEKALGQIRMLSDGLALATALATTGDLHDRNDRLKEAEEAYVEALPIYRAEGHRRGEAAIGRALGSLYARTDRLDEAEEAYREALPIAVGAHDLAGQAALERALGDLYVRADRLDEAMAAYERALPIANGTLDLGAEAAILKALSSLYAKREQWDMADASLREALPIYRKRGNRAGEANARRDLGDILLTLDRLRDAEAQLTEALAIYRAIEMPLGEANALASLGNLALSRGDAVGAFDQVLSALEIHRRQHDSIGIAKAYGYLSRAALRAGRGMRAVVLGAQSHRILQAVGDRLGQVLALRDIARGLSALGRSDAESAAMLVAWSAAHPIGHPLAEEMRTATGMPEPPAGILFEAQVTLTAALSDCESELLNLGEDPWSPLRDEGLLT